MATPIGTLGTIPTLTVANRVFTDLTTLIIIGASCTGTNGMTFRKPTFTSGYAVTTGKTLTINAFKMGTSAASSPSLAQSDNDIGSNTATAMTNAVYVWGSALGIVSFATTYVEWAPMAPVAATKYLTIVNAASGNTTCSAYGYEA